MVAYPLGMVFHLSGDELALETSPRLDREFSPTRLSCAMGGSWVVISGVIST